MDIVIALLIAAVLVYLAYRHHEQSKDSPNTPADDIDFDDDVPPRRPSNDGRPLP